MSGIYFTQTKLSALGKKGILKPDADGFYTLVGGGLEVGNNGGSWYYTKEALESLFNPSTIFRRRLANGSLRAEANHPRQKVGESNQAFADRYMDIDLTNVAAFIKDVWFDEKFGKEHPEYGNPDLIAIMMKVKPFGPMGKYLQEALDDNPQNVCFSVRGVADEGIVNYKGQRRVIRILRDLFAIDWVNEGGITMASKWDTPACESMSSSDAQLITRDLLERISKASEGMAAESSRQAASTLLTRFFPAPNPSTDIYEKW